jgi:hypothetical protein
MMKVGVASIFAELPGLPSETRAKLRMERQETVKALSLTIPGALRTMGLGQRCCPTLSARQCAVMTNSWMPFRRMPEMSELRLRQSLALGSESTKKRHQWRQNCVRTPMPS